MYLLVSTDQLKSRSGRYETMPDGRSIVPMSDQRILAHLKMWILSLQLAN